MNDRVVSEHQQLPPDARVTVYVSVDTPTERGIIRQTLPATHGVITIDHNATLRDLYLSVAEQPVDSPPAKAEMALVGQSRVRLVA